MGTGKGGSNDGKGGASNDGKDDKDEKKVADEQVKRNDGGNKTTAPGGLPIRKNQIIERKISEIMVGGISGALMEIPPQVTSKLRPPAVIHKDDPIFPTESRTLRVKMKNAERESFMRRLELRIATYDMWAIQSVPHGYVIAFDICIALAPILLILTIWDLLAVCAFAIPQLSTLNRPGVVYPFYPIGTVASFYGYMMRFLMEDMSKKTYICFTGVCMYPVLLILRCLIHYFFNGYRDETKLWY